MVHKMGIVGKEAKMNKAAAMEPKSGHRMPAAAKGGSEVGGEKKADVRGAQMGNPTDKNPLRAATRELEKQHPIKYNDMGPHHGMDHHMRHEPLAGLKPRGG